MPLYLQKTIELIKHSISVNHLDLTLIKWITLGKLLNFTACFTMNTLIS